MVVALLKAAIFYWVFTLIRRFLRQSQIFSSANPTHTQHSQHSTHQYQQQQQRAPKSEDIIEADYEIIN